MRFRQIVAWLLLAAVLLTACGGTDTPAAPDDAVVQNDITDYITELLDDSAAITAYTRLKDSTDASRASIDCSVTYGGDQGEYSGIFSLEYSLSEGAWTLEQCSLELTERPEIPTEEPSVPVESTTASDPTGTEPPVPPVVETGSSRGETESGKAETKNIWKISHSKVTLYVGESFNLRVTNQNSTSANVSWRAKKSGIVTISGKKITAVAKGETTITGSVDGQTFTCTVTVKEKAASTPTPVVPEDTVAAPAPVPTTTAPPPTTTEPPPPPTTTEPKGKAPSGYSIRVSPSEVILYQHFYVTVNPNVDDYTKIVIHAVDPKGTTWDFTITGGNSKELLVDQADLTGTWTIYADVYNDYGVFRGSSSGSKARLKVNPMPF